MNFTLLDYIIVSAYIILIIYSGSFVKKYIGNMADFLVADRSMGFHLGLVSLLSSEIGIITYMYLSEAGYKNGFVALMIGIPFFIVFVFLGKTGFIVKPLMDMKIMTLPELFQKRFGRGIRFLSALLMAIGGIINFGVFPGIEANFINTITGIPHKYVLFTMVVMLTIVLIYTALGGMVSVIITNYIQFILLSFGMVFIVIIGVVNMGWGNIVASISKNFGEKGFNPFIGDFGWSFIVWQLLFQLSVLAVAPFITMRIFSAKDTKTGRKIFTWSSVMFLARAVIPVFWGILALSYFTLNPGKPADPMQAVPLMILHLTPKGILGLVFASLLAASMSTYASYLLSWSSVISQDIIGVVANKLRGGKDLPNKTQMIISRLTMLSVMIFIIWWSFFYHFQGLVFFYLMLSGNLYLAGTLISAIGGIYFEKKKFGLFRARSGGAYVAFILGAMVVAWYFFPQSFRNIFPDFIKNLYPKDPINSASILGYWSYIIAAGGMIIGSFIHNIIQPLKD